jgi:hypothetical protein
MRQRFLWSALALLTFCASSLAHDGERTGDGAHQVAYAVDPITGEYLFVEDIDPRLLDLSEASPLETSAPSGNLIQMNRIAELPVARWMLTTSKGFDMDQDGQREFIIKVSEGGPGFDGGLFQFYECTGDNSFVLVHEIEITDENDPNSTVISYIPGDVGDADYDGLTEVIVYGRIGNDFHVRVYESEFVDSYPTEMVWDVGGNAQADGYFWQNGAEIADTDGDGWQEIVVADLFFGLPRLSVYENDGDNSYHSTYSEMMPGPITVLSQGVLSDIDGDGRDEILIGGLPRDDSLIAYESTGDDSYAISWTWLFEPLLNPESIVDAGDLDGDGKNEFLVGGLKLAPFQNHLHLYEAIADNKVEIVETFVGPGSIGSFAANVADIDGDGTKEIIFGSTGGFSIYRNGGFAWNEIWSESGLGPIYSIGAGDHDGDGKDEIIIQDGEGDGAVTAIYEIDPAYQADMDNDNVVDVIDNCPITANPDQEDADNDTVGDVCDNCIYGPNSEQGPAIFGQAVVAEDSQTFSWSEPAEIVYVRGDLSLVSTYMVDLVQALPLGTSFMDSSVPASSEGFFYLVKPDCGVGSWQTTLGAEPGRDAALP